MTSTCSTILQTDILDIFLCVSHVLAQILPASGMNIIFDRNQEFSIYFISIECDWFIVRFSEITTPSNASSWTTHFINRKQLQL